MADRKKEMNNAAKPKNPSRKEFDEELVKLCKLQEWMQKTCSLRKRDRSIDQ